MAVIAMGKIIEKLLAIPADALTEDRVARITAKLTRKAISSLREIVAALKKEQQRKDDRESARMVQAASADRQFIGLTAGMADFYDAEVGACFSGQKKRLSFFDSLLAILAKIEQKKK